MHERYCAVAYDIHQVDKVDQVLISVLVYVMLALMLALISKLRYNENPKL